MKTWIKRTLLGVAALVVAAVVAVFALATLGDRKLVRHVDVAVVAVPLAGDAASVERGGYLFRSRGCGDCHGRDGSGGVVVDDGKSMLIRAPNLTAGPGGVTAGYRPVDGGGALPVELSGLPIFDRARNFAGYRGFGVCRDLEGLGTRKER